MWREQHDCFTGEANISIFQRQQFTFALLFMQVVYLFSTEYNCTELNAVWLAQSGERSSAARLVLGSFDQKPGSFKKTV